VPKVTHLGDAVVLDVTIIADMEEAAVVGADAFWICQRLALSLAARGGHGVVLKAQGPCRRGQSRCVRGGPPRSAHAQTVGGHSRAAPAKQRKENPMNYYLIRKVAALTVAALAFLYYVLSLDLTLVKSLDLTASLFP
jgi:hypothetical protein